jgi:hypothetical protein
VGRGVHVRCGDRRPHGARGSGRAGVAHAVCHAVRLPRLLPLRLLRAATARAAGRRRQGSRRGPPLLLPTWYERAHALPLPMHTVSWHSSPAPAYDSSSALKHWWPGSFCRSEDGRVLALRRGGGSAARRHWRHRCREPPRVPCQHRRLPLRK